MKCPKCNGALIQKSDGNKALRMRINGPMLVKADGAVTARCYWCKAEIELPLQLQKNHVEERFVISGS